MYRVLVTEYEMMEQFPDALELLAKENCKVVKSSYPPHVKEKDLLTIIKGIDAIITGGDELTAHVIEVADKLKVIAKYGVGVDKIDVGAAARRNIPVTIAPNQDAVADLAFGLMLCLARRICESSALASSGGWKQFIGTDVWQKTLGVVGTGRIGRALIKRAGGFDMKVLAYDIFKDDGCTRELGFTYTSLDKLLQESDFVSLHCPLTDTTQGLLSKEKLALMKPSAYLINTARAQIVDEEALAEALKQKRLAGAALDAYAQVPPPDDFPFFKMDNVITTTWIGACTWEAEHQMALTCVENIVRVLKGKEPLYALDLPGVGK